MACGSDTVLVTGNGYELLTQYPTDLETLTIQSYKPLGRLSGVVKRRAVGMT